MDFDVLIVGGGLAGLALGVALRQARLSVGLVETRRPERPTGWDARIYAISPANQRFLNAIGAWEHLAADRLCPVETMTVFGDAGGHLDFSAYEAGVAELAWIVEASAMQMELWESAKRQANLSLLCPAQPSDLSFSRDSATLKLADGRALSARLIVAADGANSWTRAAAGIDVQFKPYGQHGVVANFDCQQPHFNRAFQWFRPDGILAYLPLPGNRISIVWSTEARHAEELVALPPDAFCQRVADAGQGSLGTLELITPPVGFPLRLMRPPRAIAPRLALIGDAAHAIHPLSGHGINLGYQDADVLATLLTEKPDHIDCGDPGFLRRYERSRREDVVALQTLTDGLQKLFSPGAAPLAPFRNAGLSLTNRLSPLKNLLVRYALAS